MLRLRCRSTAAVLVLLLTVALAAPPAAAAPISPASGSWWSALVAGVDALLDLFGLGETTTESSSGDPLPPAPVEEGPGLEPDGVLTEPTSEEDELGGSTDPYGAS